LVRVFSAGEDVVEAPLDDVDEDLAKIWQCMQREAGDVLYDIVNW
jgi:hypothetical protein